MTDGGSENGVIAAAVASARWWELAGHDAGSLAEAWEELHHAVLAASEVGRALSVPREDGLESCLGWYDGGGLLEGFFGGMTVGDPDGAPTERVRAALRVWERTLYVIDAQGGVLGSLELEGATRERATVWALEAAMNALDTPAVSATGEPARGPGGSIARGGVFGAPNQLAQAELIRLYANTASVLDACRGAVSIEDWEVGPTVVWSDRFEMSAEFVALGRDARSSVRVGLRPPRWSSAGGDVSGAFGDDAMDGACWFAVSTDGGGVVEAVAVERVSGLEAASGQAGALGAMLARVLTLGDRL